ncbi:MAG: SDR family oxidoreductase [Pseudomonadota bacterium]
MHLQEKVAVITGAASGIGRAMALRFAQEGAKLIIADVRETPREGGRTTMELLEEMGGQAQAVQADVSHWADVEGLVAAAVNAYGRLDVMVNNAVISFGTRLTETAEAEWDQAMAVNLKGVFFGCKAAVTQMLTQEATIQSGGEVRGRIVNISSQHGMISCPGDIAYGVSKAGVVYMTRQIAADYAKDGIVCNAVAPGKIITGKGGEAQSPETLAYATSRTPWPRLGRPSDVASAAVFLASDDASYITGENLMVDGGWRAG